MIDDIPESILKKHPELIQIGEAIEAYSLGLPITVCCPHCGQVLTVVEVEAANALWVSCGEGCTAFRALRS